ncbi:MAG: histidine--tRNA ligase [Bacteroidetes bacterium]|nr:histidine--tRNA ligase [Bacteroidota bacterium]
MKPSIPKGTRDFSPDEMVRRNFILQTIRNVYERYGFRQIETPAMENLSMLEGKYGEEGDKLLFRILNSGDVTNEIKEKRDSIKTSDLSEKGLRYDLTVPFARYVVMHRNEITFPFRRYQMQPVWRADRPQKGRYREFYQCDADVIGSDSLLNEAELVQIIADVFSALNIGVSIKINNRKILAGIAEILGQADKIIDITVAIDKLDKIGAEKVNEELRSKGVSDDAVQKMQPLFSVKGNTSGKLAFLDTFLEKSDIGKKGIEEVRTLLNYLDTLKFQTALLDLDITLARGLNYYTGAIFEVKVNDTRSTFTSSVLGGGRYDDLTGIFGLPDVSGVGISFGIDRIYDVMLEMDLFDKLNLNKPSTKVLLVNFGSKEEHYALTVLQKLRAADIKAEIYPDAAKMKKQMAYADAYKIPYVLLIGDEEMQSGKLTLKNMTSGEQSKHEVEELMNMLHE